jgi:hypothetical protein
MRIFDITIKLSTALRGKSQAPTRGEARRGGREKKSTKIEIPDDINWASRGVKDEKAKAALDRIFHAVKFSGLVLFRLPSNRSIIISKTVALKF